MTAALTLTPHIAGLKVVIIESAERMTIAAANALLKSLEEPTRNTYLFLLAERPGRLPATIRSRCQQLSLKRPAPATTLEWLEAAGLATDGLPWALVSRAPLAAARVAMNKEKNNDYNVIYDNIKANCRGRSDPHAIAERWSKGDTELALDCLVQSLQAGIRRRFVPERSTPVTEPNRGFDDNSTDAIASERLFEGLQMAENLREQIGRGINVELALTALLLGLEPPEASRV
jgi:DNA polymerase-3 subunit delta'